MPAAPESQGSFLPPGSPSPETLIEAARVDKIMRNKWTKGNTVSWIQLSLYLREDPRIERLIENEKMRGLGLYISIVLRIYSTKCRHLTMTQCMQIKEKGCAKGIVKRVIYDYALFNIDSYNHVSSAIDFLGGNEISHNMSNDATQDATNDAILDIPTPAPAYYKNKKENKKNDYHHSKKSDGDDGGDGDGNGGGGDDVPSVYRSEPMPRVLMDPIQYIHSLPLHSAWTEALLQTLGITNPILRQLVMEQWEETKQFFALHAQAQSQVSSLLSEKDVKRYFTNCLNNATLARKLQEHLAAQRAKEQKKQLEAMRKLMEEA